MNEKRDKILIALIFMMACLLLVPVLFTKGWWFDVVYYVPQSDGSFKVEHGLYHDNVFYTIMMFFFSFFGFIIPYFKPNLNKYWKWISCICGAWFLWGLIYEFANFTVPEFVLNTIEQNENYIKALVIFTLSLIFIITHSIWHNQAKSQN